MLFKFGIKYRYILIAILLLIVLVPLFYFFLLNPTQQERIKVFINPELDPLGSGYNAIQSKIAVGSGMLFGTGLLKGAQTQYGYLPIKSTDFIFSVISDKMDKTVVVAVQRNVRHKIYGKTVKKTYKLKAHDEENKCQTGDTVKVMETRPLSKDKRWRVVEIVEKAVIK